ncbi:hypothetical protein AnigIFM60653_010709 [Aspergillus niger]|nr:hypothetical protein AnigIFM60653_010709 [Aspergillus niger]
MSPREAKSQALMNKAKLLRKTPRSDQHERMISIRISGNFYANFQVGSASPAGKHDDSDSTLLMADDRVSFGPKMSILAATHENNIRSRPNGLEFALEISIGSGATILAGLSVGEGCTNGVGVVMTKEFTRLCDERQPECSNCVNRSTECVYALREVELGQASQTENSSVRRQSPAASSTPSSSGWMASSDSLPRAPELNLSDMELLLQWCSSTYATMAHDQQFEHLYQYVLPKQGLEYPFVLHGLLALSALHIARASDAASRTRYFSIALEHQNRALALFRPVVSSINRDNSHPIFVFASLLLQLAFAIPTCSPLIETHDSVQDLLQAFTLCRGLREILGASWQWVKEGKLADVFTQVDDTKHWPLPETLEVALSQLKYLNETRGKRSGDRDADCYDEAINHLKDMMEIYQDKPRRIELALRWPFGLASKYLKLLKEHDPMALVILAHYCLVLHHFRHHWWMEGWSFRVAHSIWDQLHESWRPYVSWVVKEVGLEV